MEPFDEAAPPARTDLAALGVTVQHERRAL
jgi:hypothetical protein